MSDIPDLIEPIDVQIKQLDKTITPASSGVSGRREFMGSRVRFATVTLPAQIIHGNTFQRTEFSQLGPDEQAKGYLVLRFADLDAQGINLKRGDKIIKMGQLNVELFILHSSGDPAAHFSSIGGFTLLRVFFGDRNPVG